MKGPAGVGWPSWSPEEPARAVLAGIRTRAEQLDHGMFGIGIEILPYELVGVVTDVDGSRLAGARIDLADMKPPAVIEEIAGFAEQLAAMALDLGLADDRLCLGVALGGPIEPDTGLVHFYANNPHDHGKDDPPYTWRRVPLLDLLEAATGCASTVHNDADAYAVYEQKLGAGRTYASFALLMIRHGVGAGVVLNNQLLPIPAEVGHLTVGAGGRPCDCGQDSHVESRTGRRAIPAMVSERTGRTKGMSFEGAVGLANDPQARCVEAIETFAEAGVSIAQGLGSVLTMFGLSHVVIYGPEDLIDEQTGVAARIFLQEARRFPEYTFRHFGNCDVSTQSLESGQGSRGALGAALIALQRHFSIAPEPSWEPVR